MKTDLNQSPAWRLLSLLANMKIAVVGLALLLVLTVWGTVYQVENGLYQAQQVFFRSWFFLAGGFFPFPGGQLVMAVVLTNLVAACVKLALQGRMMLGILLTHGGLILMLGAGAVTFYLGVESHLTLMEGQASNVSSSSAGWELAVWPVEGTREAKKISAMDAAALKSGETLPLPGGGFELFINEYAPHSEPLNVAPEKEKTTWRNGSGIAGFTPLPRMKEP